MASPTWWTWIWASSWSWWWTGKPNVLQSMGLQSLHWATKLNWTERSSIHGAPDKCTRIQQPITLFTVIRMKESIHPAWSKVSLWELEKYHSLKIWNNRNVTPKNCEKFYFIMEALVIRSGHFVFPMVVQTLFKYISKAWPSFLQDIPYSDETRKREEYCS